MRLFGIETKWQLITAILAVIVTFGIIYLHPKFEIKAKAKAPIVTDEGNGVYYFATSREEFAKQMSRLVAEKNCQPIQIIPHSDAYVAEEISSYTVVCK